MTLKNAEFTGFDTAGMRFPGEKKQCTGSAILPPHSREQPMRNDRLSSFF